MRFKKLESLSTEKLKQIRQNLKLINKSCPYCGVKGFSNECQFCGYSANDLKKEKKKSYFRFL